MSKHGISAGGNIRSSAKRWDGSLVQTIVNNKARSSHEPIIVPYYFDKNLPEKCQKIVLAAIQYIEEVAPGIRFNITNTPTNYIHIVYGKQCRSRVGMIGSRQILELAEWATKGNALHELMHTLGFVHEHQREDRNQYVQCASEDSVNYGIEGIPIGRYDADSIMQYQPSSSLQDRNLWAPYQRDHLSNGDKIALNKLYPPAVGFGGWIPQQGTTGLYYCERHNMEDNNAPFGKIGVNGYCNPNKGPNCPTCRHYGGIQERRNDEGRKAKQGETGLFY